MRFVTLSDGGPARAGILSGGGSDPADRIADVTHSAFAEALGGVALDCLAMVKAGLADVAARLAAVDVPVDATAALGSVLLHAPIERPGRIFGVAHNYRAALAERGMANPAEPVVFDKRTETIVGPGAPVVLSDGVGGCTYEAELAAVIGAPAKDIRAEDALGVVAGYAAFNDVSASDIIRSDGNFDRGKNFPAFGPFGPFLATADEIPDPQNLAVSLTMDRRVLQDGNTADMIFSVAALIAFLSRGDGLAPGDVIATGTPAGVAPLQSPPSWLRPGCSVTVRVQGLGALTNPAVAEPVHA